MRRTYSSFARAEPLDLVRLLAVGAHDAHAGERLLDDRADVGQLRLDRLEALVDRAAEVAARAIDTNGSGISAISVSRASIDSISTIATTNTRTVFAEYMTAGPIIMRTAFRSLVARDIRSPVRRAW